MRRATALLLAAVLALAVGCRDGDDDEISDQGGPAERVATAPDRTRADRTARTSFESTLAGMGDSDSDDPATATGEGLVDFEQHRGSLDIDLAALLAGAGIPGLDAQAEILYEGSLLYLRSDLLSSFLGVDTPWIRVDLEAPASTGGIDLSALATLTGNDPGAQLGLLAGIDPESVTELGAEEVRGEKTIRYSVTVDLPTAAGSAASEAERQRFERLMTQLDTAAVDLQVDLDRQGRVRRLAYEQPLPADAGGGTSAVVLEYYDFGTGVDLTLPAADQVTDLADTDLPGS